MSDLACLRVAFQDPTSPGYGTQSSSFAPSQPESSNMVARSYGKGKSKATNPYNAGHDNLYKEELSYKSAASTSKISRNEDTQFNFARNDPAPPPAALPSYGRIPKNSMRIKWCMMAG